MLDDIERLLAADGATEAGLLAVLDRVLERFGCAVGTLHSAEPGSALLRLRVQRGLPEGLLDRVREVPFGKGMAGIAAERREPVQVCNLQGDASGVARPGAKLTRMEGSIAVPILVRGEVRGVLGVAKPVVYEFSEAETAELRAIADTLGKYLGGPG